MQLAKVKHKKTLKNSNLDPPPLSDQFCETFLHFLRLIHVQLFVTCCQFVANETASYFLTLLHNFCRPLRTAIRAKTLLLRVDFAHKLTDLSSELTIQGADNKVIFGIFSAEFRNIDKEI
jgi:hypothetical protein